MLEEKEVLYLESKDLDKLKKIGHGTDGSVYYYKNNLLIKIYHKKINQIIDMSLNDNDVKIYKPKSENKVNDYYSNDLTYYAYSKNENETIKFLHEDGLKKAIERRDNIKLTSLPIKTVYVDGRFAGCLIERQKGIQIHKLIGLPISLKRKIYLNILKAEEELLKNNIYHTELGNSPFVQKNIILPNGEILTTGHSHILVNPFTLSTHFIDLDGQSTTYTENGPIILNKNNNSINLMQKSFDDLTILTLEFLLGINYEEIITMAMESNSLEFEYKIEELSLELERKGLDNNLQNKLIEKEMTNIEDFYEVVKRLKK